MRSSGMPGYSMSGERVRGTPSAEGVGERPGDRGFVISKTLMSRAAKRLRVQLTVTAHLADRAAPLVCRTKDVSLTGAFLETHAAPAVGTKCTLTLLDQIRGD